MCNEFIAIIENKIIITALINNLNTIILMSYLLSEICSNIHLLYMYNPENFIIPYISLSFYLNLFYLNIKCNLCFVFFSFLFF